MEWMSLMTVCCGVTVWKMKALIVKMETPKIMNVDID
jgi:hypothetical protein